MTIALPLLWNITFGLTLAMQGTPAPATSGAAQSSTPARRVAANGGVDFIYGAPSGNSLEECKTTYSPANQNAMFYRQENGGITNVKVIDNVTGVTTVTQLGGLGDKFFTASDMGSNFAHIARTDMNLYYTTNSGVTWHTLTLPTSAQHTINWGVE
ncbi:MAG: hypothetical protein JNJ88_09930, partial [Planctomycetes bacterium]|nr:hypothetical protein [Planctomycetota bacterium]